VGAVQHVVPADEELAQVDEPLRALGPEYQEPESVAMCAADDGNLKPKTLNVHLLLVFTVYQLKNLLVLQKN
jgi:hypothetical protein